MASGSADKKHTRTASRFLGGSFIEMQLEEGEE